MKRGFTLIELAIVLVIVGLLTGGILAAQTMIKTARMTRFINDLHHYEIAVKLFNENFKYWPGDYPAPVGECMLAADLCKGDGDGSIDYFATDHEGFIGIGQIVNVGYLSNLRTGYITAANLNTYIGSYIPKIAVDASGSIMLIKNTSTNGEMRIRVGSVSPLDTGSFTYDQMRYGVASAITGIALDSKIDDGQYDTGKFTAVRAENNNPAPSYDSTNECYTGAGPNYSMASVNERSCYFEYTID